VVFREGPRYTAPNAADEAILNEYFYRDVFEEPKPIEQQPTECQTEESLDDESPPKPMKKSRELAGLETSLEMHRSRRPKVVAGTALGRIRWQSLHNWLSTMRNSRI